MQYRKEPLDKGYIYHVFSRSIAGYQIFKVAQEYSRMLDIIRLYRYMDFNYRYSRFIELEGQTKSAIINTLEKDSSLLTSVVAYCLMPTHLHLILKQIENNGISNYMSKILNSYSRFFNSAHKRIGPLWAGRFKSVLIKTDEQLLHLTRYIHLNPTSAGLCKKPDDWIFSSYREYTNTSTTARICSHDGLIKISPTEYRKFVSDRKAYQRELSIIKQKLIDDYSG